jgi:hypothetical protein
MLVQLLVQMDSLRKDVVAKEMTLEQLNNALVDERAEKVNTPNSCFGPADIVHAVGRLK